MDTEFDRSMNGGRKRKWLKENRKQVLWVAENCGEAEACRIFNMKPSTLERLGVDELTSSEYKWSKSDNALLHAKLANAGVEEVKDRLAELDPVKEFYASVILPTMKLYSDYYDKLTAPERERQELLQVPVAVKDNQLTQRGPNLYVM